MTSHLPNSWSNYLMECVTKKPETTCLLWWSCLSFHNVTLFNIFPLSLVVSLIPNTINVGQQVIYAPSIKMKMNANNLIGKKLSRTRVKLLDDQGDDVNTNNETYSLHLVIEYVIDISNLVIQTRDISDSYERSVYAVLDSEICHLGLKELYF